MAEFLRYINDDERRRLLERASRAHYEPGTVIIKEGESRRAIFLIRRGVVRVELEHPEFNIEVTRLGKGEIFGEMSFFDDLMASASVVAHEAVEADVLDSGVIQSLIAEDPGFYGRFYQSLAETLAIRLRDTTLRGFG